MSLINAYIRRAYRKMEIVLKILSESAYGEMDEITDYLYISGYSPVTEENVKKIGIGCIVDAANVSERKVKGVETLKIKIDDHESAAMHQYFDLVSDKIKENKENNLKTLVHCMAGVSRSATLCIVYFVKHENLSLKEAYEKVFQKRSVISPNTGFWKQMIDYEKQLRGCTTVNMVYREYHGEVPDVYFATVLNKL